MATVSAAEVKKLREMTSAGYGDCRKALMEAEGNLEEAVRILRTQGRAKAEKKQGRATAEGLVKFLISEDRKSWAFVEVNCETDFVAREATFEAFVEDLLVSVLAHKAENLDAIASKPLQEFPSLEAARENLVLKVGENVQVARVGYGHSTNGVAFGYQHGPKLSVVVALSTDNAVLGKDVAIHVAAMQPAAIKAEDLPESMLAAERSIYEAQLKDSGKPADIQEKIIAGKMRKFSSGLCLYGQDFVKDPTVTVEALLKQHNAEVLVFNRMALGEAADA